MFKNLFICVEGLFELGDSIGFDAVHQWRVINRLMGDRFNVRIFCRRFDQKLHPDVPAEPFEALRRMNWQSAETLVIYHFCDGWPELEEILEQHNANFIVRWHNNTPPWFFARYGVQFIDRTIRGYRGIIR